MFAQFQSVNQNWATNFCTHFQLLNICRASSCAISITNNSRWFFMQRTLLEAYLTRSYTSESFKVDFQSNYRMKPRHPIDPSGWERSFCFHVDLESETIEEKEEVILWIELRNDRKTYKILKIEAVDVYRRRELRYEFQLVWAVNRIV